MLDEVRDVLSDAAGTIAVENGQLDIASWDLLRRARDHHWQVSDHQITATGAWVALRAASAISTGQLFLAGASRPLPELGWRVEGFGLHGSVVYVTFCTPENIGRRRARRLRVSCDAVRQAPLTTW